MAKLIKLSDIAEVVGVSTVTVSKALSNKVGVSDEMRTRIKEVAEEMGYISKTMTKNNLHETNNIGVLIPARYFENTSFYWEFYHRIVSQLTEIGYFCILEIINSDAEESLEIPKVIQEQKVDGVILIGQAHEDYLEKIVNLNQIPTMVLDCYDAHIEYDTVISDGFYGMYILTNYLLRMGHRKIGFVGTTLATSSITDRYLGYYKALLEYGIQPNPEWVIPDRDESEKILSNFNLPQELPTAFACNCDLTAHYLISTLKERNLKVPEDMSIVGFDNFLYADLSDIKITTYEVNIDNMVKVCIDHLIKKIKGLDYPKGISIVTGSLIIKESVQDISCIIE